MYTLYLIRGVSGSGKSTLARMICDYKSYDSFLFEPDIFEADDYFVTTTGEYKFDKDKLTFAHEDCLNRAHDAMEAGLTNVIVSNTFSRRWEMAKYKKSAKLHGYNVFVVECQNNFKSTHDVPEDTIRRMRDRFEDNED